jgi:hypothetical protein
MDGTTPGPTRKYQTLADHKLHIYKEIIRELIVSSEHDDEADADTTSTSNITAIPNGPE